MRKLAVVILISVVAAFAYSGGQNEEAPGSASMSGTVEVDPDKMYTFVRAGNWPYPPENDGELIQHWRDTLNVDLQYKYLESQTAREQLNLLITSGEVPDIMPLNFNEIGEFKDQGIVGGWTEEFVREWAPNLARVIDEWGGEEAWALSKIDGLMYTLPGYAYNARYAKPAIIRTDWLDAVGIDSIPDTLEEAEEAFYAFTRDDPDGNGRDDTYGLSREGLPTIYGAFGFEPELWLDRDGELVYGSVVPEAKDALALLRQWYADGVLDPEYVTGENTGGYWALTHSFINARIGFTAAASWYHWQPEGFPNLNPGANTSAFVAANPDGEFQTIAPFEGPNGFRGTPQPFLISLGGGFSSELVSDGERFAKLLQFIDYFCDDPVNMLTGMNGFQGRDWDFDSDGNFVRIEEGSPIYDAEARFAAGGEHVSVLYFHPGFIMDTVYKARFQWGEQEFGDKNYGIRTALPVALPSASMYLEEGNKLLVEGYHAIITGERPVDYFDDMVDRWYQIGGEQLTTEANDWYTSYKENF